MRTCAVERFPLHLEHLVRILLEVSQTVIEQSEIPDQVCHWRRHLLVIMRVSEDERLADPCLRNGHPRSRLQRVGERSRFGNHMIPQRARTCGRYLKPDIVSKSG